jgi:hypothetical protein
VTAPRMTALAADDEARRELLDDARRIVAGTSMMLATREMVVVLVEAVDASQADVAAHGALLDAKELELREAQDLIQQQATDLRRMRDENLATERLLTAEREKSAGLLATLNDPTLYAPRGITARAECNAKLDGIAPWSLQCTEPKGHPGDHVARGLDEQVLATWPNTINEPRSAAAGE